ncbi:MAG TPA: class I SAM-dependent methyltransferase [Myxococcota bacterium]|nr:class I SAM-dependent methyltransferase [Myxococcota bacterium]
MDPFTRRQLLELSSEFYRRHAAGFDASRAHHAWPGWQRVLEAVDASSGETASGFTAGGTGPTEAPSETPARPAPALRVLDIGCGNARLAAFLHEALRSRARVDAGAPPRRLAYVGVDSNASLLEAARERLSPEVAETVSLVEQDFLAAAARDPAAAGRDLPAGPFDLVALFGVLHHVPDRALRLSLLRAARDRLAADGVLALAAWQFADRPRFARHRMAWRDLPPVLGAPVDPEALEPGDHLLRFGEDPEKPPRYCHQVSDEELDSLPDALGLVAIDDFRSDGAQGDLNRYRILRAPRAPRGPEAPDAQTVPHDESRRRLRTA